jgi:hypothetical protein
VALTIAATLPQFSTGVQYYELFLQVEKRILVRRGIFQSAHLRPLTMTPSKAFLIYIDFLIDQLMRVIEKEGAGAAV